MRTYTPKPGDIHHEWHLIDASGQTLGRMATRITRLLMGKNKAIFTPNLDTGDYVVVINAEKVHFTGTKKGTLKLYYRHSMYPGGFKSTSLDKMMEDNPTRVITLAVKGMLPHTRLGAAMFRRLKVYAGAEHPYQAQVKTKTSAPEAAKT